MNTIYAGIAHRRSDVTGTIPTVPKNEPESATELFDGEIFVNTTDKRVFIRAKDTIEELVLKYSSSYQVELTRYNGESRTYELYTDGISKRMQIEDNTLYTAYVSWIGLSETNRYKKVIFSNELTFSRMSGSTVLDFWKGAVAVQTFASDPSYDITVDSDTNELVVTVTPADTERIYWKCILTINKINIPKWKE